MDSVFSTQAKLRQDLSLHKIIAVSNRNYKRHGTKSYVSVLNRFGFRPTKPGPYFKQSVMFMDTAGHHDDDHEAKPHRYGDALFKKTKGDDKPGTVTAEDQQNDAEYLCEVSIGTKPQKVMLDFDTGSADLWVSHKKFNPDESSTFMPAEGMSWKIQYGDGSSASGTVGSDVISIGGLKIMNQAIEIATRMSAQFSQGTMDGLLGLAFRKLNTIHANGKPSPQPTPIENMITQKDIPKDAELFTSAMYSTRDNGQKSFYTFGWIDQDLVKASGQEIAWTTIDNSQGFWMFKSERATINGKAITLSGNTAIADTGTTLALVSDEVCDALYAQIKGAEYSEQYQGYTIPRTVTLEDLPDFSVAVGDKEFVIQKEDLVFAPADDNVWYGGLQSRGDNPFDILGDTFLKSIYAIWDQGNGRFGAVPKIEKTQNIEWNFEATHQAKAEPQKSEPKNGDSRGSETKNGKTDETESKNGKIEDAEPKTEETKDTKPKTEDTQVSDSKEGKSQDAEQKPKETQTTEPKPEETQDSKPKTEESQDFKPKTEGTQDSKPKTEGTEAAKSKTEESQDTKPETGQLEDTRTEAEKEKDAEAGIVRNEYNTIPDEVKNPKYPISEEERKKLNVPTAYGDISGLVYDTTPHQR